MIKIYSITPIDYKEDSKVYVGSTINLDDRIHTHFLRTDCTSNILKEEYGWDNLRFTILEECDEDIRLVREQYWIDTFPNIVNERKAYITDTERRIRDKECRKIWLTKNRDSNLQQMKKYNDAHKEQYKQYNELHKEEINAKRRERYKRKKALVSQ